MSELHRSAEQRRAAQDTLLSHLTAARALADQSGQSTCAYLIEMAIKEAEQSCTLKAT